MNKKKKTEYIENNLPIVFNKIKLHGIDRSESLALVYNKGIVKIYFNQK
jgi:hypothetical protein